MAMDERRAPLSFAYAAAALILITGALLWAIFNPAASKIFSMVRSKSTTSAAADHIDIVEAVWTNMAFFVLFAGLMYILARAYYEAEVT